MDVPTWNERSLDISEKFADSVLKATEIFLGAVPRNEEHPEVLANVFGIGESAFGILKQVYRRRAAKEVYEDERGETESPLGR